MARWGWKLVCMPPPQRPCITGTLPPPWIDRAQLDVVAPSWVVDTTRPAGPAQPRQGVGLRFAPQQALGLASKGGSAAEWVHSVPGVPSPALVLACGPLV